jgi:hypothetical protein
LLSLPSIRIVENLKLTMKPTSLASSNDSHHRPNHFLVLPASAFSSTLSPPATGPPNSRAQNTISMIMMKFAIHVAESSKEGTFDFLQGAFSSPSKTNSARLLQ